MRVRVRVSVACAVKPAGGGASPQPSAHVTAHMLTLPESIASLHGVPHRSGMSSRLAWLGLGLGLGVRVRVFLHRRQLLGALAHGSEGCGELVVLG